jgi:hypothetical protein
VTVAWVPSNARGIPGSGEEIAVKVVLEAFLADCGSLVRFDTGQSRALWPNWTLDGKELVYQSPGGLLLKSHDGTGEEEMLARIDGPPESWSPDGKLAVTHGRDVSVISRDPKVKPEPVASTSGAAVRFTVPMRGYDVSHDGQRFLTVRDTKGSSSPPPSQMIVVLNWQDELKQRVPPR